VRKEWLLSGPPKRESATPTSSSALSGTAPIAGSAPPANDDEDDEPPEVCITSDVCAGGCVSGPGHEWITGAGGIVSEYVVIWLVVCLSVVCTFLRGCGGATGL